jgi:hypothetical protein
MRSCAAMEHELDAGLAPQAFLWSEIQTSSPVGGDVARFVIPSFFCSALLAGDPHLARTYPIWSEVHG